MIQVKEMDDEEQSYHSLQEPSYRIETGNYEYRYNNLKRFGWKMINNVVYNALLRLVLRCRQDARARFAALRSDVQV